MPSDPNDHHRKRAFVSHSGPDDRYVQEFVQLVRSLGYDDVFNDSHTIEPDEKFWERIERGIRECDAFVVILSHASVKSYWVDREVTFAREQGRRVIPIRIDDCKLPASFDGRDVIELKHQGKAQRLSPPRFIHHAAEHFLGREPQLALLDEAWINGTNVLSIIAWGGVGKTALLTEWVQTRFIEKQWKTDEGQPALDAYFDWTFYDQGTRSLADGTEARTGSVGDFFEQALVFFGDPDPNLPGKGRRLADLIRQQRSLILLDGLEPLQQPPGHPQAGRLLDPDLRDLLASLAQSNPGLCIITSRQALTDLHSLRRTVHTEHELEDLPVAIATRLLRQLQIKGTDQELAEASEKFGCHALSLTLLGRYLFDAHGGDIARTDRIRDLQRADTLTREDRHRTAWRILETYEHWLATAQADGNPKTLAVLRLTGLFDRTATADCLSALRAAPVIRGLTDAICGMAEDEWNILLKRLERAHLIKLRESSNLKSQISDRAWAIDAHPLIREYFAKQLKQTGSEAFKVAHSRLARHMHGLLGGRNPVTVQEMGCLFQAVRHFSEAGETKDGQRIFTDQILGEDYRATKSLGLITETWSACHDLIRSGISSCDPKPRGIVYQQLGYSARAMGDFDDAFNAFQAGLGTLTLINNKENISICLGLIAVTQLYAGQIHEALQSASKALDCARHVSCRPHKLMYAFCTLGKVEHYAGIPSAEDHLLEAVKMLDDPACQVEPSNCTNAWCRLGEWLLDKRRYEVALNISERALSFAECKGVGPMYTALHLANKARALMHLDTHNQRNSEIANLIHDAIDNFRRGSLYHETVRGHLLAAEFFSQHLEFDEGALHFEEAQQIAERGPMPLYLADVHLHRARLFGRIPADERRQKFPDIDPQAELREARRLIEKHGYWRRREELEDAEAAAVNW